MRRTGDRIRHAISFEIVGLLIATPLGAWAFGFSMPDMGVIGILGSLTATLWNYVFNLAFDHAMKRAVGHTRKDMSLRVLHTVLFEGGLFALFVPFISWYLDIGIAEALVMEIAFALFYLVYTFCFNLAYDWIFPIPEEGLDHRVGGGGTAG